MPSTAMTSFGLLEGVAESRLEVVLLAEGEVVNRDGKLTVLRSTVRQERNVIHLIKHLAKWPGVRRRATFVSRGLTGVAGAACSPCPASYTGAHIL